MGNARRRRLTTRARKIATSTTGERTWDEAVCLPILGNDASSGRQEKRRKAMGHNVDGFPVSGASLPFLVMTEEKRKIVVHAPPGRKRHDRPEETIRLR